MCNKCSEIRCKLYSKVSGLRTQHRINCGSSCKVIGEHIDAHGNFGNDFKTFLPFMLYLLKSAIHRLKGKRTPLQQKNMMRVYVD